MAAKTWYPIFLDLTNRRVVVIGGGKVALRKARGLVESGARVTVVAPRFDSGFDGLPIERRERPFEDRDIDQAALVFAAAGDRNVNRRAGEIARAAGIPANIADAPGECDFIVPSRIRRDNLQIAISTSGEDPALAAELRRKLEEWLDLMRP